MSTSKNRYMLIDGNALIHRGYHAIPGLTTKSGIPTGAVFGFTSILLRAIKDLKPTHIAATFDLAGPTFRHEKYSEYKAGRVAAPDDLYEQIPLVKGVVAALGIPIFEKQGYEADDLLGTLARHICEAENGKCHVMIVTGDMDTLQLVNDCVSVYTLKKGLTDTVVYGPAEVEERFGLKPSQMVDYRGIKGDPSDNIPGVKGIGEKGAIELISRFGSLDNLFKAIHAGDTEGIKPRTLQLLIEGEKAARESFALSLIIRDVQVEINIPPYEFGSKQLEESVQLFQKYEFKSLMDKLPKNYYNGIVAPEEAAKPKANSGTAQNYTLVDSQKKVQAMLKDLAGSKELSVDTETTSTQPMAAALVGISLCARPGIAYYVTADIALASKELKALLEDSGVRKIGHNIKYDFLVLQQHNISMDGIYFDSMLASYLLNPGSRQHSLDTAVFNEFGYTMQPITDLIGTGKNQTTMDKVDVEKVSWYAAEDADFTLRLYKALAPEISQDKVRDVFDTLEMPLIPVLAAMERVGIIVDVKLLNELEDECEKKLAAVEREIYQLTDTEFNVASPKQLKEVLFDKLQLKPVGGKKTKTGLSTAAGELDKMLELHPVIPKILEFRELAKLLSTYIKTLPLLVNKKTGRIHTSYNQTIAATGRLSSTDPNLQNIPAGEEGMSSKIRKAFVAKEGYSLLSLDYSQIELRLAAHLSGDENMKRIFAEGLDIHTQTAVEMFGVAADKVGKDQRRAAKAINFGILYGLSAFGLSYGVEGLNVGDAKKYIDKYFESFPSVRAYLERVKLEAHETGVVRNELGRMRKFPDINSKNFAVRGAAERAAINFPLQSLASDIIKTAMLSIFDELQGKENSIQMLLQVHDELVFEVKDEDVKQWSVRIKHIMENAYLISIPIIVEAKVGRNWGELEKVK